MAGTVTALLKQALRGVNTPQKDKGPWLSTNVTPVLLTLAYRVWALLSITIVRGSESTQNRAAVQAPRA